MEGNTLLAIASGVVLLLAIYFKAKEQRQSKPAH